MAIRANSGSPDLILFAKQPIAGQVKTRLHPPCSADKAAEIAAFLVQATVETAAAAWPGDVYLYVWPNIFYPLFERLSRRLGVFLKPQATGDLGRKMLFAFKEGITRRGAAVVMGADVPQCSGAILQRAYDILISGDNVIGPSNDGGYYLLGINSLEKSLFKGMAWGQSSVFQQTLECANKLDMIFKLLPALTDIDTWDDLCQVARNYPPLRRFVAHCLDGVA